MNNIRIRTTPQEFKDNVLKVELKQDFDFLEILSLSISQEEVYRRYCSDYGVVVGRVIMNNGVGIPNVKVSIFIPLDDDDMNNPEISGFYPFDTAQTKDDDGKRYNLLPDSRQFNCHTPVGTFPTKREILDNDLRLGIHCKYYRFTTVTNDSGDFMLFGVPTGSHIITLDCDLSDIGIYSQRPYDFMREGQPKNSFDSSNKFKYGDDLDKLTQIKSQKTSINVVPFWGDTSQCEIGITRLDFDLKHELKPSAIFMGSIFGDNEKNSINKRCRPRKNVGKLCEMVSGPGTIEMLRKNLDGANELYNVEGGRVINDDGAWAYQIPMNLDYMVTNEFGDLVPSDDPKKGIPTRANVRFKIGMDVSGGEGKLRTRAKYLVPNNPNTINDADYTFDERTTDVNFRNIYWNKIYSIKNFITRFQTSGGGPNQGNTRNMIGIKDVDNCTGLHNPFPFNRMDTDINPLFSIICIIVMIISYIVLLINSLIINLINGIIFILNQVLMVICEAVFGIGKLVCYLSNLTDTEERAKCRKKACIGDCDEAGGCNDCDCSEIIPYIPCITLGCEGEQYGPGCLNDSLSWEATDKPPMEHWPNDGHPNHDFDATQPPGDAGWAFCIALTLAESLNIWEFDFYNDWINGSLYAFLLKYKKKRRGKEKFCEYDCDDFNGGVDGDDNNSPDNNCRTNWLVDTCVGDGVKTSNSAPIRDGLIKWFEGELYYASYTHTTDYKLFATDLIDLGAVFECDWQGRPKLQPFLVQTTYKTPELLDEYDDELGVTETSGFDGPAINSDDSLFFNINCLGIFTNTNNCINIRRQCELGVGLDEYRADESANLGCDTAIGTGNLPIGGGSGEVDRLIGNCDIDNLLARDMFALLNNPTIGIDLMDSTTYNKHSLFDVSTAYYNFRNYSSQEVSQPRGDSFYFYFGLMPGKTGLDLMNSKYFEECLIPKDYDFIVVGSTSPTTNVSGCDGTIDITIIGGDAPFTYQWSGPSGYTNTTQDLTNLCSGNYTVIVTDANGAQVVQTFNVGQPFKVSCHAMASPVSVNGASDGMITISNIGGGDGGPYTTNIIGPVTQTHVGITSTTDIFNGLPAGDYVVTTSDSGGVLTNCAHTGVTITTPPPLIITGQTTDVTCHGFTNGKLQLGYISGVAPITWLIVGNAPLAFTSTTTTNIGLTKGFYNVTATDAIGQSVTQVFPITEPSQIVGTVNVTNITCNGSNNGIINITSVSGGVPNLSPPLYNYEWSGPTPTPIVNNSPILNNIGTISRPAGTYTVRIIDKNGCSNEYVITVLEPPVIDVQVQTQVNVSCNGGNNGSITLIASGGNPALPAPHTGTYQYSINGVTWQSLPTFNNLTAGTYTCYVRDNKGCQDTINVVITQPPIVLTNVINTTNNSITLMASGGNGGVYEYRHRVAPSGTWSAWTTNPVRSGLMSSTNYNLQSRDLLGCESAIITNSTT